MTANKVADYELKLADGSLVIQKESNGLAACHRFANTHPNVTIIAWRGPLTRADVMLYRAITAR